MKYSHFRLHALSNYDYYIRTEDSEYRNALNHISQLIGPSKRVVKFHVSAIKAFMHLIQLHGRHLNVRFCHLAIWMFIIVFPATMVTNSCLCLQLPPTYGRVTLKRVTILFNFTKTHSNLPGTIY